MEVQNSTVPALERALNILEYLSQKDGPVSFKQIAEDLSIPPASAFRLIKNLVNRGYVREQTNGQSVYALGDQITMLALMMERGATLPTKAAPYMQALSAELGQTTQLAVLQQGTLLYIGQVMADSPGQARVVAPLYTPLNIHISAAGKVLFSHLTKEEQRQCLRKITFSPATEKTIRNSASFLKEIAAVRAQGYALDDEEYAVGIGCMAVPIFRHEQCIAAIGITGGIAAYHDPVRFAQMLQTIQKAAEGLSKALTFY